MAEALVFIGIQGAGKTTYFHQHFSLTHVHASRDIQKTAAAESAIIAQCIREQRNFAVDDTNPTRQSRAAFLRDAKAAGFRVSAVFFDIPTRTAIGRNQHRSDKRPIPVPAILRTAKQLEAPSMDEGFDQIITIGPQP